MKTILLSLFILAIFISSIPPKSDAQWVQTNGPGGGHVSSFVASGTNLFAGTLGGGVFLSTNSGTSWTAANTGLTQFDVNALAVSGTNLFAATDGGVFLSTNNGTNWVSVSTGLPGPPPLPGATASVYAVAVSGTNLFAATDSGVFVSTNNGTSWTAAGLVMNDIVSALAIAGTNLFAATVGDGVFLSTNGGTNWTAVNTGLTSPSIYAFAVSGPKIFAGTDAGVHQARQTWKRVDRRGSGGAVESTRRVGRNRTGATTVGHR